MDCGFDRGRLRVTRWLKRYIVRLAMLPSICLALVAINRVVSGNDTAILPAGLYDPNLHIFADDLDIERTWDVFRVLGKPKPLPSAIIAPDKLWEKERRIWIVTGSVFYDPRVQEIPHVVCGRFIGERRPEFS